jgi:hypothetical protein
MILEHAYHMLNCAVGIELWVELNGALRVEEGRTE